jgi:uncharacterized protein (DUF2249 family)
MERLEVVIVNKVINLELDVNKLNNIVKHKVIYSCKFKFLSKGVFLNLINDDSKEIYTYKVLNIKELNSFKEKNINECEIRVSNYYRSSTFNQEKIYEIELEECLSVGLKEENSFIFSDSMDRNIDKIVDKYNLKKDSFKSKCHVIFMKKYVEPGFVENTHSIEEMRYNLKDNPANEILNRFLEYYDSEEYDFKIAFELFYKLFFSKEGNKILEELNNINHEKFCEFIENLFHKIPEYTFKYYNIENNEYSKIEELKEYIEKMICFYLKQESYIGDIRFVREPRYERPLDNKKAVSSEFMRFFVENVFKFYDKLSYLEEYYQSLSVDKIRKKYFLSQKVDPKIFWMRVLSMDMRAFFDKPNHKIVADIINLIFDSSYTEYDVINNVRNHNM